MRKIFLLVLLAGLLFTLTGVVVFNQTLDLPWLDSIYFVITIMTTVGFGDISLLNAPPLVKIFGIVLMLVGTACLAAMLGIITDYLVKANLNEALGLRRRKMKDHIIVCGLGNVGYRVVHWLHNLNENVLVIERNEEAKFVRAVRSMKVPVVIGDMSVPGTLERANIQAAKCLMASTANDLLNIETALNARAVNKDIRLVLRVFDTNLAEKLQTGMDIDIALSTSALSAPAFAMAAVNPAVVGSFYVADDLMLNVKIAINKGSPLADMSSRQFLEQGDFALLAHQCAETGERSLVPNRDIRFAPGDIITVAAARKAEAILNKLNSVG